jgi:REP element-mobilizing transposase RayT
MGRALRPRIPGVAFHLTARVHGGDRLLAGLQAPIVSLIRAESARAGTRIIAYAVMSNHLHLVASHGNRPLGAFMQPLLRRVALLVRGVHGVEGHVFGRRYAHRACLDASYFRNAIAYVNLNGVRAGLCATADEYPWSSHRLFASGGVPAEACADPAALAADNAVRVFAAWPEAAIEQCRADYLRFLAWRLARDAHNADAGRAADVAPPEVPTCAGGDAYWAAGFGVSAAAAISAERAVPPSLPELRNVAARALHAAAPGMPLDLVRGPASSRPVAAARRAVIASCLDAGYGCRRIAAFLGASDSTVSRVAAVLRAAAS